MPDAVVFPHTTDEVAAIVRACAATKTPIVAFGMGSSLEAHVNAIRGGISIDLTRMTRVVRLSAEDLDITVEAGLTHRKLNDHLKNTGLMFPVDPGADATIGGMTATRASGTTAVRYGTMRENVLGAHRGPGRRPRDSHRRARAQVIVRLRPHAPVRRLGRDARGDHRSDAATVRPARSRECGGVSLRVDGRRRQHRHHHDSARRPCRAHRDHRRATTRVGESLLEDRLSAGADAVLRVSRHERRTRWPSTRRWWRRSRRENGALGFRWASTPEDRATLWQARHNVLYATIASRPGAKPWTTDVCVPISRLVGVHLETQEDLRAVAYRRAAGGSRRRRELSSDLHGRSPTTWRNSTAVKAANERLVERALRTRRHLHRRARRRHRQDEVSGRGTRRVARRDARDQESARSGRTS